MIVIINCIAYSNCHWAYCNWPLPVPLLFFTHTLSVGRCRFGDVQLPQFSASSAHFYTPVPHRAGEGVAEPGWCSVGGDLSVAVGCSADEDQPAENRQHGRALHGCFQPVQLQLDCWWDQQSHQWTVLRHSGLYCSAAQTQQQSGNILMIVLVIGFYSRRVFHSFGVSSFHSRTLLQATLALSLVVSSLKLVCCDFSIFSTVMLQSPGPCLTWHRIPSYTHHFL